MENNTNKHTKNPIPQRRSWVKVRRQSSRNRASWKGSGGEEPERHFRGVWSADAQARSSTLESRGEEGGGVGVRKRADEI